MGHVLFHEHEPLENKATLHKKFVLQYMYFIA